MSDSEVSQQERIDHGVTERGDAKIETVRNRFSNWLKCIDALNHTKTALHDLALINWKKEVFSWKMGEHIPVFFECVSADRVKRKKKTKDEEKGKWFCDCEHSQCNTILEKILQLQRNQGGNIVWRTVLCDEISRADFRFQSNLNDEEQENIPRYESSRLRRFWEMLLQLTGIAYRKEKEEIEFGDIFKGCKQEHIWCIANMFMQHGKEKTKIINTKPSDTDASMFFKMMKNCNLFYLDEDLNEQLLTCRNKLHHSATNRLSTEEAESYVKKMIEFLQQYKQPPSCKQYWDARQNLDRILRETILSVYVPDKQLQELSKQATTLKETALKVDIESDKSSGLVNIETVDLLKKTKKEKTNILLKNVCESPERKSYDEVEVNDPGKHFVNMAHLVKKYDNNEEIIDALVQEVLPRLHQIVGNAAKDDDDIKESLEEVYELERPENSNAKENIYTDSKEVDIITDSGESENNEYGEKGNDNDMNDRVDLVKQRSSDQNDEDYTGLLFSEMNSGSKPGDIQRYTVRVTDRYSRHDFLTFCRISPEEIVMAERVNRKVKKLDNSYKVIESLGLYDWPFDICSIGNHECVVALPGRKLQFVNAKEKIELSKTVTINHDCTGLTFYEGQLYIADTKSVYQYSRDGEMLGHLYTNFSENSLFRQIAVSLDGNKIYVTNFKSGLITIDLTRPDASPVSFVLHNAEGLSVDDEGNVLMCGCRSNTVLKVSPEGKKELDVISVSNDIDVDNTALYYDRQNKCLLSSGSKGDITVLKVFEPTK